MSVALVASALVNQHLYLHDMLLVSLAIGFAAAHTVRTTGSVGPWAGIAAVMWLCHLPVLAFAYKQGFPLFPLSTLALFVLLLREAWRLGRCVNGSRGIAAGGFAPRGVKPIPSVLTDGYPVRRSEKECLFSLSG